MEVKLMYSTYKMTYKVSANTAVKLENANSGIKIFKAEVCNVFHNMQFSKTLPISHWTAKQISISFLYALQL